MKRALIIGLVFVSIILICGISACKQVPQNNIVNTNNSYKCNFECCSSIECSAKEGFTGEPFCGLGGDVNQNEISSICFNPGTPEAKCNSTVGAVVKESCKFGCENGKCKISEPDCYKEGEGYNELSATKTCCEGLNAKQDQAIGSDGNSYAPMTPAVVCTKCGDHICSSWENKCVCSEDCS